MPKFFVCSDIHAFYDEWIDALEKAGFDWDDKSHWLVVCGDYFDRGPKPIEVMKKLMNYPRAILVKGNHESLYEEACKREWFQWYDFSNGTADTIKLMSGKDWDDENWDADYFNAAMNRVGAFFDKLVPYFETENYVFCHGWLPLWVEVGNCTWREASPEGWEEAMWENGMKAALGGDIIDKTVVCGHFHTSWGHHKLNHNVPEFGDGADFSPFYYGGCIAIDACTAYSGQVNVVVLEDDFLDEKEFKNGDEATESCLTDWRKRRWEDLLGETRSEESGSEIFEP